MILSVYIARCSLFAGRMLPEEEKLLLLPFPVSPLLINPLLIVLCLLCTAEDHAVALGLSQISENVPSNAHQQLIMFVRLFLLGSSGSDVA